MREKKRVENRREEEREKKKKNIFFFFNDTATTEIYTLSLHDALPISQLKMWCTFGMNEISLIL